jgi:hypothetical protein
MGLCLMQQNHEPVAVGVYLILQCASYGGASHELSQSGCCVLAFDPVQGIANVLTVSGMYASRSALPHTYFRVVIDIAPVHVHVPAKAIGLTESAIPHSHPSDVHETCEKVLHFALVEASA